MGMSGISKSQVSRLCEEIDGRVAAFLNRPLEGDWPYLWLDATYLKGRTGGRIVSTAVIIAVAVNGDGRREVLGMDIGPSDAETFWTEFLRKLARRGLRGVKLVISDAHEGLKAAVAKVLHASWQRCRVPLHAQRLGPLGLALAQSAFAQQQGGMSNMDMQTMMNHCAQMQQNRGAAPSPDMQRMMAQCDQMERMHGGQPATGQPGAGTAQGTPPQRR
jgi:hypothetical protein